MNREEKAVIVEVLKEKFRAYPSFYMTDASGLTVAEVNKLRRLCYESGVEMRVAKNTLIRKALEGLDSKYDELHSHLRGATYLMFSASTSAPAKVIRKFRAGRKRPVIKVAYIDSALFAGDQHLEALSKLKSKEELVGDIVFLLQSPAIRVISALKSSGGKLAGLMKTLSGRNKNEAGSNEAKTESE